MFQTNYIKNEPFEYNAMLQDNNNKNTNNHQAKSPATMPDADGEEIRLLHRNIWHTEDLISQAGRS